MINFKHLIGNKIVRDSNLNCWLPNTTEKVEMSFKTEKALTFNVIDLKEYLDFNDDTTHYNKNSYVNEFTIDAKINGKFTRLCKLDEVGTRSVLLDKDYTANEFRVTATFTDERGGISDISFRKADSETLAIKAANFRNVGYFNAASLDVIRKNFYDKVSGYTDVIMFDYGCWNEKGEFRWGTMSRKGVDEEHFAATLEEIRSLDGGQNLDIWFCLQNYDKKNVTDTETLFTTVESREKLADFAVSVCEKYNLVGVDIDYEYPETEKAWENYGKFLSLCANKLHAKGYKMSAAISSFGARWFEDDVKESIDYLNLMIYDLFDFKGRHSPYSLVRKFYDIYTALGFRPEQLVLGMPFHTRTFETVDNYHQIGGNGYLGLYDGIQGVDYTELRDPSVNLVKSGAGTWSYYFNGAEMIEDKVLYAIENNMSGVFCWCLSVDIPSNNEKGIASLGQTVIDTINRFSKKQ